MGDGFVKKNSVDDIINATIASNDGKNTIKQSANKLIAKVYKRNDFSILGIGKNGEIIPLNSAPRTLFAVNQVLPIECLRKVNEDLVYATYKVKDENGPQYFMYCFFTKLNSGDEGAKEDTELWWLTGRVMFAKKMLNHKSFDGIKVGSAISDVVAIDPLIDIYKPNKIAPFKHQKYDENLGKYVEYTETPEPVLTFTSYHLLKDGILCIGYTRNDDQSEFTVSSIGFNDTFEMPSNVKNDSAKLKIQSEDYPVEQ